MISKILIWHIVWTITTWENVSQVKNVQIRQGQLGTQKMWAWHFAHKKW